MIEFKVNLCYNIYMIRFAFGRGGIMVELDRTHNNLREKVSSELRGLAIETLQDPQKDVLTKPKTITIKANNDIDFEIPAILYHSTKREGPVMGGIDNVIWLTGKENDNFTLRAEKEGAKTFIFDLTDENCPIKISRIAVRSTNGYLDSESAEYYALEEGIDAIYDPVRKWFAYFGHLKTE